MMNDDEPRFGQRQGKNSPKALSDESATSQRGPQRPPASRITNLPSELETDNDPRARKRSTQSRSHTDRLAPASWVMLGAIIIVFGGPICIFLYRWALGLL